MRYRNYWFLAPLFAIVILYQISYTFVSVRTLWRQTEMADTPFAVDAERSIQRLGDAARKAGLRKGDVVMTVDEIELSGRRVLEGLVRSHHPSEDMYVTVRHPGSSRSEHMPLHLDPKALKQPDVFNWIFASCVLLMQLFCAAIGVYVAAVRPSDFRAFCIFGVLVGATQLFSVASTFDFPPATWIVLSIYRNLAGVLWSPFMMLFGLYFPDRFPWERRRPWLKWILLAPLFILGLASVYENALVISNLHRAIALEHLTHRTDYVFFAFTLIAVSIFFACLFHKAAVFDNPDGRRRLRILRAGAFVSLTPVFLVVVYDFFAGKDPFRDQPQWMIALICAFFYLFPVTLVYVVVVQRAMDVRMVVRQGIQYAIAKGGLRVALFLLTFCVVTFLNVGIFGGNLVRSLPAPAKIVLTVAVITAAVYAVRKVGKRSSLWLDRRFFREAYNAQQVLEDLSESVRTIVDEKLLLDTVAERISQSLHVSNMTILMNGDGIFRPVHWLGMEPQPALQLSETTHTINYVRESKEPPRLYFDDASNWVHQTTEAEVTTLRTLNAQLLLPVGLKDKLLALLSLGPKRSDVPYTRTDIQLLRSVAFQTGLALENSRLTTAVATEMAQRERLNREIEIAREVQQRLFPQALPAVAGLDYSGACRPALGVGGDYYDFLKLANGDLGIAIGDVSGKGIAAALLMASLQASLRGQALSAQGDLARLLANINQLIYDTTPVNRYATFFYGQLNHETKLFSYVNAGHNPPVILRQTTEKRVDIIRLETGGTVIGLLPGAPYQEGCLQLQPGDIFVGFTDGISEAMNCEDEEWGEERLIPALTANTSYAAADIIPRIMADADAFAAGAPQHDDMTLVVVKLVSKAVSAT